MDARTVLDNGEGLDMARRAKKQSASTGDGGRIVLLTDKLIKAGVDSGAFSRVKAEIETDANLSLAELGAIAVAYRGGGPVPATRAAAMRAIEKRQLELVRNKAQIAQAKKARPW